MQKLQIWPQRCKTHWKGLDQDTYTDNFSFLYY